MAKVPTKMQVSAGGVAFRLHDDAIEVALISVGEKERWQLPKGLVGEDEEPAEAALREVEEETGLATDLLDRIDTIEYWYYGGGRGRMRFHKYVHFFLMRYRSGDTADYDEGEVNEARWVGIGEALEMLAFDNEKQIVERAREMIATLDNG
jgi:8-oxo-dGTP pyrophosphatase MutT (NUDIX family)